MNDATYDECVASIVSDTAMVKGRKVLSKENTAEKQELLAEIQRVKAEAIKNRPWEKEWARAHMEELCGCGHDLGDHGVEQPHECVRCLFDLKLCSGWDGVVPSEEMKINELGSALKRKRTKVISTGPERAPDASDPSQPWNAGRKRLRPLDGDSAASRKRTIKGMAHDDPDYPHGTDPGFRHGCRCEVCISTKPNYRKPGRARVTEHGATMYRNGCRCVICRKAQADRADAAYQRKKLQRRV